MNYLLVFLGGGLGAAARHAIGRATLALFSAGFPIGTLLVNVIGSTALGVVAGWFTTSSAFSLPAALLSQRGDQWLAAGYVAASLLFSGAGLVLGLALTAR